MGIFPKALERALNPHVVLLRNLRDFAVPASPSASLSGGQYHFFLYLTLSLSYCQEWGAGQCMAGSERFHSRHNLL